MKYCQRCESYPCVCGWVSGAIALWEPRRKGYVWFFYGVDAERLQAVWKKGHAN